MTGHEAEAEADAVVAAAQGQPPNVVAAAEIVAREAHGLSIMMPASDLPQPALAGGRWSRVREAMGVLVPALPGEQSRLRALAQVLLGGSLPAGGPSVGDPGITAAVAALRQVEDGISNAREAVRRARAADTNTRRELLQALADAEQRLAEAGEATDTLRRLLGWAPPQPPPPPVTARRGKKPPVLE